MTQHINLYHAEFRPPKNPLPARYLLALIGLTALVMLLLYGFDNWRLAAKRGQLAAQETRAGRLETQLNELAGQVAGRHADPALAAELADVEARLQALNLAEQALNSGALGAREGYSGHFAALSRVQAAGVWLVGVHLRGAPVAMSLTGRALDSDGAARYLGALRREPYFAGLSFAGLEIKSEAAPGDSLEFHLSSQADAPSDKKEARP